MRQEKYEEAKECLEMKMLKEGAGLMTSIDMYVLTCLKLRKQERAKQIGQIYYQIASMLKIPGVNPYSALLTLALEGRKTEETWKLLEQFLAFFMNPENAKYEKSILFQEIERSEKQEAGEIQKSYGVLLERVLDNVEKGEDGAFLREDENFEKRISRLKQMIR